jgi:hypothetical protein
VKKLVSQTENLFLEMRPLWSKVNFRESQKKRFAETILGFSILDIYKCPEKCPKSGIAYLPFQRWRAKGGLLEP